MCISFNELTPHTETDQRSDKFCFFIRILPGKVLAERVFCFFRYVDILDHKFIKLLNQKSLIGDTGENTFLDIFRHLPLAVLFLIVLSDIRVYPYCSAQPFAHSCLIRHMILKACMMNDGEEKVTDIAVLCVRDTMTNMLQQDG